MNCNRYLQIWIDISERQLLRLTVSDTTTLWGYPKRLITVVLKSQVNLSLIKFNFMG